MKDSAFLTIIIHVYNIERYLPRCLECVLAQTFESWKLLLIDDDSKDGTFDICREYESKDPRIKAIKSEHKGLAQQRNVMMQYVDTEYYVSLDGDDYITPDYLKHLVDAQQKYDADMVISRVAYVPEDESRIDGTFPANGETYLDKESIIKAIPKMIVERRLNYLYGKIYRTKLWEGVKVPDDVKTGSDTMMNIQCVANAESVVLIDDVDYFYVKYNTRSVTSHRGTDIFDRLKRINCFVADFSAQNGLMTSDLRKAIDERLLLAAFWAIEAIVGLDLTKSQKAENITKVLDDPVYVDALTRQKVNLNEFSFPVILSKTGREYLRAQRRKANIAKMKAAILAITPKKIVSIYHKNKNAVR